MRYFLFLRLTVRFPAGLCMNCSGSAVGVARCEGDRGVRGLIPKAAAAIGVRISRFEVCPGGRFLNGMSNIGKDTEEGPGVDDLL